MLGWQMLVVLGSYAACFVPKLLDLLDRSLDEPQIECPHCGARGNVRRNCHWEHAEHRSLVCYGCMTAWFENPAARAQITAAR